MTHLYYVPYHVYHKEKGLYDVDYTILRFNKSNFNSENTPSFSEKNISKYFRVLEKKYSILEYKNTGIFEHNNFYIFAASFIKISYLQLIGQTPKIAPHYITYEIFYNKDLKKAPEKEWATVDMILPLSLQQIETLTSTLNSHILKEKMIFNKNDFKVLITNICS